MRVWSVTALPDDPTKGVISTADQGGKTFSFDCALGKNGMISQAAMCEGDGATPKGQYPLRRIFFRADKIAKPICSLASSPITENMGWCDDPSHPCYNKLVTLPFNASYERLYRRDDLYDIIVVLGHNDAPIIAGKGSAVFIHVARNNYGYTEGCIALEKSDILMFLNKISPDDIIDI